MSQKPLGRPELETERLLLRPLRQSDAEAVAREAGRREVWVTTLNIPHPYNQAMAEDWIATHEDAFNRLELVNFGLFHLETDALVGIAGIRLSTEHRRGEIGYWISRTFWGKGYATEAGRAVLDYAFETFDLHRIIAHHFVANEASGRVIRKLGMKHEGTQRQHILKDGHFVDVECYGLLRDEWEQGRAR